MFPLAEASKPDLPPVAERVFKMATNFLTRVLCTCTLLAAFPVAVKADLAHEFGFDGNAADAKSSFVFNLAYTATASGTSTTGMFGTNCLSGLNLAKLTQVVSHPYE